MSAWLFNVYISFRLCIVYACVNYARISNIPHFKMIKKKKKNSSISGNPWAIGSRTSLPGRMSRHSYVIRMKSSEGKISTYIHFLEIPTTDIFLPSSYRCIYIVYYNTCLILFWGYQFEWVHFFKKKFFKYFFSCELAYFLTNFTTEYINNLYYFMLKKLFFNQRFLLTQFILYQQQYP